jgi:hypothetical protein
LSSKRRVAASLPSSAEADINGPLEALSSLKALLHELESAEALLADAQTCATIVAVDSSQQHMPVAATAERSAPSLLEQLQAAEQLLLETRSTSLGAPEHQQTQQQPPQEQLGKGHADAPHPAGQPSSSSVAAAELVSSSSAPEALQQGDVDGRQGSRVTRRRLKQASLRAKSNAQPRSGPRRKRHPAAVPGNRPANPVTALACSIEGFVVCLACYACMRV